MKDCPLDLKSVSEQLCEFLRSDVLAEGVSFDETTPLTRLGIDSLSIVELLLLIERRFGIAVPESRLTRASLHSVAALARCVCELSVASDPKTGEP